MPKSRDLLSLQEAMDWLGVSRATIDRWRRQKQLPYIKIGKEVLVDKAKLEAWVRLHESEARDEEAEERARGQADPNVVAVGYQSGAALLWSTLVVKQLGLFEAELAAIRPRAATRVRWLNAPNGMELVEELIAGNVHIASVGDYPIIASHALSRMLPRFDPMLIAFAGKTQGGGGIALVAPPGQARLRMEALAERKVSTVANSSASYRLREWMKSTGLEVDPVHYRRMGDCLNGLVDGRVGATMLWEPYLTWARTLGAGVPIEGEEAGEDYLTGLLADGRWAAGNEDAVIAYLKAHLKAHAFIRAEPERAARIVRDGSGFPLDVVSGVLPRIRWDASIYRRDLLTLNRVGEGQPELPRTAAAFGGAEGASRFLQEAAASLKLPALPDAARFGEWSSDAIY